MVAVSAEKAVKQNAKPFLKWAGGKGQLISEIKKYYPFDDKINKYAEPFVGGGAVLFDILNMYTLDEIYISDTNAELINTYCVIRDNPAELVERLCDIQDTFLSLNEYDRKKYYTEKRSLFNALKAGVNNGDKNIQKAALLIFLNKTCFNGLYRVNRRGEFNVPIGSYKKPIICDESNIYASSEKLKNVNIVCGDYKKSETFIDEHTFVYCDPPYRPISSTSSFTAYSEKIFDDKQQLELADFINKLTDKGAKVLISNSDPKNLNSEDDFFEIIYSKYNIKKVLANRMINSNASSRGKIKELMISNF